MSLKNEIEKEMFIESIEDRIQDIASLVDSPVEDIQKRMKTLTFSDYIKFYIQDSLIFLREFSLPIDLLYLDSLDGHNPIAASNHQLKEAQIAVKKLHDKSLILLDDKGSKTNLSINFFIENNFRIIYETKHQVLLSK